ncbi:MAG TPA: PAS domain S-box protein [Herpetosiphonaceae bacterium]
MIAEIQSQLSSSASAPDHTVELDDQLQTVVDGIDAIIWAADVEQLQPAFVNQQAATILGYPAQQWLSEPIWQRLLHPDDRERVLALWRSVTTEGSSVSCEHRCVAADGRVRWFQTSLRLHMDAQSRRRLHGLTFDITTYRQAESELRASELRYRFMVENSTDMIARHALDGQYLYVSSACQTLLGYTPDELIGRSPYDLFHPDDVPTIQQAHAALFERRDICTVEYRIRHKSGSYVWFETTCRAAREAETDTIVEIYTTSRDVTQRKRAEEESAELFMREQRAQAEAEVLRKTDRLKSELIANVSHELRTPLHHIKGYASTLLRPRVQFEPATVQEYLRIITEESDKLERLIVDLLDTSRIETGALSLEIDSVQLDEIVRNVVQRWQGIEAHTFGLCIPEIVPLVAADPYRIEQVLDNLLANVVKHTPSHTLTIVSIEVSREQLLVSVADQGPGIGTEHIPHLFDRFYQADTLAYRHRNGSGLGLYICKGIVEQHGGAIWVDLVPNGGAAFRFTLPRRRSLAKQAARSASNDLSHGKLP